MQIPTDEPLGWAVLSGATLDGELLPSSQSEPPAIQLWGNRQGLLSLSIFLIWASSDPAEHECLSLTGLPFVRVHDKLSLTVRQSLSSGEPSRMQRTDQVAQFEWLVSTEDLESAALGIAKVAFTPDAYLPEYYNPTIAPDSDAILLVGRA